MLRILCGIWLTATCCSSVQSAIIDFEAIAQNQFGNAPFTEDGFQISLAPANTMSSSNVLVNNPATFAGDGPSANSVFQNELNQTAAIRIVRAGGGLFEFFQLDLAPFSLSAPNVSVVGFDSNNPLVTATDVFDPNVTADSFATFSASNLSGVLIDTLDINLGLTENVDDRIALDNIVVTASSAAIPEPSSFACLLLGGIGLYVRRRRRS